MKKIDGDGTAMMSLPRKPQKKTSKNGGGGINNYSGVEILRPVLEPSVDPSRIAEAVRYVMNNDKRLKK